MSLKAKLEAVIYAAEEPVMLAQLGILFADEALAWKADQGVPGAQVETEEDDGDYLAEAAPHEVPLLAAASLEPQAAVAAPDQGMAVVAPEGEPLPEDGPEESAEQEEGEEAREKRLARLRDREVKAILRQILDELIADYTSDDRGVEIREIAGGYRMATKPECHDAVRGFVKSLKPALKLSLPALETLAVIAYKQPVTAPEVNEIRGVESSGVFGSLLSRKLIATAGRKQVIGRPILYKTTREFLLRFGLKDLNELPSMEEFEKIAAGELDDVEEVTPMEAAAAARQAELDANRSETEAPAAPEELEAAQVAADSEPPTPEASAEEPKVAE